MVKLSWIEKGLKRCSIDVKLASTGCIGRGHNPPIYSTPESEKTTAFSIWKKKLSKIAALLPRIAPSALKSRPRLKQYLKPDVLGLIDLI